VYGFIFPWRILMARVKFDGVIEAAHYAADSSIAMVRAYERRGATFSDRVLMDRQTLVERLKKGKKFVTGQRTKLMASTFETGKNVRLSGAKGQEVISTADKAQRDLLEDVPVF
jgi:hypothetical protein